MVTSIETNALSALARQVAEVAVLKGQFVLRSGKTSKFYLDKYRLATQPQILSAVSKALAARVPAKAQLLAGPELGAVPLVAVISLELNKPYVIVRKQSKEYGTSKRIEGVYSKGQSVVLIEDVLTTGGAVISAAEACRDEGLDILGVLGILNRNKGVEDNLLKAGFPFLGALFSEADLGMVE